MTIKIRSDATGGAILNENGIEAIKIDGTGLVTNGGFNTTGDFKFVMRASAPLGWIAGDGGTIGNVGSGATRANADTQALFFAWWADYSDALLPILTSAGAASTRGASALADWNAGKRLTVFDVRDRVPRASGGPIQNNGAKLEASRIIPAYTNGPLTVGVVPGGNQQVFEYDSSSTINATYGTWAVGSNAASDLPAYRVRGASIGMLGCFKL